MNTHKYLIIECYRIMFIIKSKSIPKFSPSKKKRESIFRLLKSQGN
jgi:hypothetical protein